MNQVLSTLENLSRNHVFGEFNRLTNINIIGKQKLSHWCISYLQIKSLSPCQWCLFLSITIVFNRIFSHIQNLFPLRNMGIDSKYFILVLCLQKLLQMYPSGMQCKEAGATPIQRWKHCGDHLWRGAHTSNREAHRQFRTYLESDANLRSLISSSRLWIINLCVCKGYIIWILIWHWLIAKTCVHAADQICFCSAVLYILSIEMDNAVGVYQSSGFLSPSLVRTCSAVHFFSYFISFRCIF